ncbi:MAG: lysylphosphatidylglycerol synthase transmembrane domain-containing protein [Cytophagales bacterium]|nr:lysylphosphatidylglycerol synthase transmembrane domain-containing protein [Cytophagales bacterium]
MSDRIKKQLKTLIKIVVSVGAMVIVFRAIDWEQTKQILISAHPGFLLIAVILFVLSKVSSALRLNVYFRNIALELSEWENMKLAWLGMFYNLFLPGGIGGDGYKVYLLHKRSGISAKLLAAGALVDRLSGMVALCALACIGFFFLQLSQVPAWLNILTLLAGLLAFPVFYGLKRIVFKSFTNQFLITSIYSLFTQGQQVICAYFILLSLDVSAQYLEYQVLFLVSSVVAVLPFTIGGVGARELTFILGHEFLLIDKNTAVAFSLLFFLITLFVSVFGALVPSEKNKE